LATVWRKDIVSLANDFLDLHKFKDFGPMGQQFTAVDNINGIASAVSVTEDVIHRAAETGANLLVVHHGLMWNTEPKTVDQRMKARIQALNDHNMTLLAYHLALDIHPLIGNNINAVRDLGVENPVPFADIGWGGELSEKMYRFDLIKKLEELYPDVMAHRYFLEGVYPIRKVCAITGSGGSFIHQAKKAGYDLIITGEAEEPSQALAKELVMHFVAAGHYQTEKSGVQKLGEYLGLAFNLPHSFIDDDNPV
jgi:dinuclear metal center YbgI/SA1388 family protein